MPSCSIIVRSAKSGNLCHRFREENALMCKFHEEKERLAEPLIEGKCRFILRNNIRCKNKCDTNGYCGYHQVDTIGYRHMCGRDSICGCLPPGYFKQLEIEEKF